MRGIEILQSGHTIGSPRKRERCVTDAIILRPSSAPLPCTSFFSCIMHFGRNGPRGSSTWWHTPSMSRKTTFAIAAAAAAVPHAARVQRGRLTSPSGVRFQPPRQSSHQSFRSLIGCAQTTASWAQRRQRRESTRRARGSAASSGPGRVARGMGVADVRLLLWLPDARK